MYPCRGQASPWAELGGWLQWSCGRRQDISGGSKSEDSWAPGVRHLPSDVPRLVTCLQPASGPLPRVFVVGLDSVQNEEVMGQQTGGLLTVSPLLRALQPGAPAPMLAALLTVAELRRGEPGGSWWSGPGWAPSQSHPLSRWAG